MLPWIRERFAGRAELPLLDLHREFRLSAAVDPRALAEVSVLFEEECGIPLGRLRPDDPMELFCSQPPTRNPLRWLLRQYVVQEKAAELGFRLKQARRSRGHDRGPATPPRTVRDYVLCWVAADDHAGEPGPLAPSPASGR
jgi:hypothetical protein